MLRHLALACLLPSVSLGATLVEDTNIKLKDRADFDVIEQTIDADYIIALYTTPELDEVFTLGSPFSVEVDSPGFAELVSCCGHVEPRMHRGEKGQAFSLQSIENGHQELWQPNPGEFVAESRISVPTNESIWFGMYTRAHTGIDSFGWIELVIGDDGSATMLDNAIAYDVNQIVIGQNAVPEPTVSLAYLSVFLITLRNRFLSFNQMPLVAARGGTRIIG